MDFLINFFIFILVLFIYIHINYQYKRSEDLEIYELDYTNNNYLQEVCIVKQPVLFDFKIVNKELFELLKKPIVNNIDLNIKDTHDYYDINSNIDSITLPNDNALKLLKNDANSHYFTENNHEFVEESIGFIKDIDEYLKPQIIVHTKYDFCTGSRNCCTPIRYHTNYRQFYLVTNGKISIKMTPFKSSKYLHPNADYDIFEFRSPINVWNIQDKYLNDMDKIKFLEFDILEGNIIFIPPYWWYSIKYTTDESTMIGVTYNSLMNVIANVPYYVKYYFQQQNIQTKTIATLNNLNDTKEPDNNVEINAEKQDKTI